MHDERGATLASTPDSRETQRPSILPMRMIVSVIVGQLKRDVSVCVLRAKAHENTAMRRAAIVHRAGAF